MLVMATRQHKAVLEHVVPTLGKVQMNRKCVQGVLGIVGERLVVTIGPTLRLLPLTFSHAVYAIQLDAELVPTTSCRRLPQLHPPRRNLHIASACVSDRKFQDHSVANNDNRNNI